MKSLCLTLPIALMFVSLPAAAAFPNPVNKVTAVQDAIAASVGAIEAQGWQVEPDSSEFQGYVQDVVDAAGGDLKLTAEQLIAAIYDYDIAVEAPEDSYPVYTCVRFLDRSGATDRDVLDSILPHLGVQDPGWKKHMRGWLDMIAFNDQADPPNFNTFKVYMQEQVAASQPVNPEVLEYMMSNVGRALPIFEAVYDPGDVYPDPSPVAVAAIYRMSRSCRLTFLKPDHPDIPVYKPQLVQWVSDVRWWVRLFAADVMATCLDILADPAGATLANDPNDLVKKRGLRIQAHYAN